MVRKRGGEAANQPIQSYASRLVLGGIVLLYVALSFYQIDLPGLHYDEAFEAVPALHLWQGQPVTTFRNSGLALNGQTFPLMTQDYIGAVNTYAAIPFIAILGPTPAALRVMSILVGATTLGLTYLLTYQLSGSSRVGLVAALLLAVDPTFIFWNRQGIFVTAITATIGLAATYCWLRRWQGGPALWTVAGAFLFGLGIYAKLLFLWLIAALAGAAILINLPRLIKRQTGYPHFTPLQIRPDGPLRSIRGWKTEIFSAVMAFLIGGWPLIVYNIQTGGTFLNVTQNAATSYYGVNNLAFGPNLLERLNQFRILLSGSQLWYLGKVIGNSLPILAFGLILMVVLVGTALKPTPPLKHDLSHFSAAQIAMFPFLVIGLVILASIGTVSALWITHFAILMPWPAIAMALGGWFVARLQVAGSKEAGHRVAGSQIAVSTLLRPLASSPHPSRLILTLGLGLLVVTNLASIIRYHLALTESGGLSSHSDAVYDLSSWLADHTDGPIVAMDWGLAAPVTYLTGGRVMPTEVFGYIWESDAQLTTRLNSFIAQPATFYLWRAPDEIIFDRSPEFKTLYRPLNLEETIEAAFYERSGRPILGITRLVPKGTAVNPPK